MAKIPLLLPVIAISLGQYLEFWIPSFCLYVIGVFLIAIILRIRKSYVLLVALLLGSLTALESRAPLGMFEFRNSEPYFASVVERPRFRRVGEIKFVLEIYELKTGGESFSTGRKVFCRGKDLPWENESRLEEGDFAFVKGRFRSVQKNLNPFSFEQQLQRRGISHECKLTYVSAPIKKGSFLKSTRNFITHEIKKILGEGEDAGLFLSMSLGHEDTLSDETEQAFKNTGMAHLLVVSGYQISIVYFSALYVFIFIIKSIPRSYLYINVYLISAVWAFISALLYAFLVGIEPSVLRALCATFIFLASSALDRRKSFASSMLVSLLLLQLIYPLSIFEPGVQLTFAALIGLAMGGDGRGFVSYLKSSTFASIGTAIVSYFWFGSFSLLGLILNPLFASLISIVSCNFGFLAIILYMSGLDRNAYLLTAVSYCLSAFRDLILKLCYA